MRKTFPLRAVKVPHQFVLTKTLILPLQTIACG